MTTPPEVAILTGLQTLLAPLTVEVGTLVEVPTTPDRVWVLAFTRAGTDPEGRWGSGILHLHTRGLPGIPLDVHDLADPLVAALNGLHGLQLGTVTVNDCQHLGTATGRDGSKRPVRTDSFSLDLDYQA